MNIVKLAKILKKTWILLCILFALSSPVHALEVSKWSLSSFLHFGSGITQFFEGTSNQTKTVNVNNSTNSLELLSVGFPTVGQTMDEVALSDPGDPEEDTAAEVLGKALAFPNPFKQTTGTTIGYRLSKNMDIEIRVFDMLANQVFKGIKIKGSEGAQKGYNKLRLDTSTFNGVNLSAGVYFFLIINEGNVLARGKLAVIP